jgi:hypothetical protein
VELIVMAVAERHGELVRHFEAHGARLGKAEMVGVRESVPADNRLELGRAVSSMVGPRSAIGRNATRRLRNPPPLRLPGSFARRRQHFGSNDRQGRCLSSVEWASSGPRRPRLRAHRCHELFPVLYVPVK